MAGNIEAIHDKNTTVMATSKKKIPRFESNWIGIYHKSWQFTSTKSYCFATNTTALPKEVQNQTDHAYQHPELHNETSNHLCGKAHRF